MYRPNMDPLSQIVSLLRPKILAWRVIEAHDEWAIQFPKFDAVKFGQLISGNCEVVLPDGRIVAYHEGDFLLLSSFEPWIVRNSRRANPVDYRQIFVNPGMLRTENPCAMTATFFAGSFQFDSVNADLVADLIPSFLHIRSQDVGPSNLGPLLRILSGEATNELPGRGLVMDRLLEIVLVAALRFQPPDASNPRRGLIAGLADPKIAAALRAMHADTQKPWTVATLAGHVGMSRSAFSARFSKVVGSTPIDYLSKWRMNLARRELVAAERPMSEIAEIAGYRSVSAFSTAFRRINGRPPSAYGRAFGEQSDISVPELAATCPGNIRRIQK